MASVRSFRRSSVRAKSWSAGLPCRFVFSKASGDCGARERTSAAVRCRFGFSRGGRGLPHPKGLYGTFFEPGTIRVPPAVWPGRSRPALGALDSARHSLGAALVVRAVRGSAPKLGCVKPAPDGQGRTRQKRAAGEGEPGGGRLDAAAGAEVRTRRAAGSRLLRPAAEAVRKSAPHCPSRDGRAVFRPAGGISAGASLAPAPWGGPEAGSRYHCSAVAAAEVRSRRAAGGMAGFSGRWRPGEARLRPSAAGRRCALRGARGSPRGEGAASEESGCAQGAGSGRRLAGNPCPPGPGGRTNAPSPARRRSGSLRPAGRPAPGRFGLSGPKRRESARHGRFRDGRALFLW